MLRSVRLLFVFAILAVSVRAGAYSVPYEAWMGSYMGEKKIGYLSYKIEKSDLGDSSVYKITSVMNNQLTLLGADLTQNVITTIYTDAHYAPLRELFSMSSGGKTTTVNAEYKKDSIECVISAGTSSSRKSVPIPKGVTLVGDTMFVAPGATLQAGKDYSASYFSPLTLSIDTLKVKIEGREKITVGGKEYDALVASNSTGIGDMKVWETEDGDVLKIQAMMGFVMLREDKAKAMSGVQPGKGDDFAVLTSLKPDRAIDKPRDVKELDIVLKGITEPSMSITDLRQKVEPVKDQKGWVRIKVKAYNFDSAKSVSLPIDPAKFAGDLATSPYIDWDAQAIKDQAKKIVGDEKNAYRACAKLRAWINSNMTARADIGITRPASDVLQSKIGVCRDYGILFAALARAAGIPSRIATGVLYVDGAFYYHVWVECYVGQWVPFDATLPTDYVDATHIKMAEGDATSMFGLAKVIGTLKAEIKSYR